MCRQLAMRAPVSGFCEQWLRFISPGIVLGQLYLFAAPISLVEVGNP